MTIGRAFFILGVAMLVLGPFRRRPLLFWSPMLAVVAYDTAFWLVTPLYCSSTTVLGGETTTSCTSVIGIGWPATASGLADPGRALDESNLIALGIGAATFVIVLISRLRRRGRDVDRNTARS